VVTIVITNDVLLPDAVAAVDTIGLVVTLGCEVGWSGNTGDDIGAMGMGVEVDGS